MAGSGTFAELRERAVGWARKGVVEDVDVGKGRVRLRRTRTAGLPLTGLPVKADSRIPGSACRLPALGDLWPRWGGTCRTS